MNSLNEGLMVSLEDTQKEANRAKTGKILNSPC